MSYPSRHAKARTKLVARELSHGLVISASIEILDVLAAFGRPRTAAEATAS
jgi:hypothetical protein